MPTAATPVSRLLFSSEKSSKKVAADETAPTIYNSQSNLVLKVQENLENLSEDDSASALKNENISDNSSVDYSNSESADKKDSTLEGKRIISIAQELCSVLEPVEFRRNRIDDAERILKRAISAGDISDADSESAMQKVREAKSKIVFRVINKSDMVIINPIIKSNIKYKKAQKEKTYAKIS